MWKQFNPSKEEIQELAQKLVRKYHTSLYNGKSHERIATKEFKLAQFSVQSAIMGFCEKYGITSLSQAGATWYRDLENNEYKIFVPTGQNKTCLFFTIDEF